MIGTIRISQLPPANNLTGSETIIVNQDGDTCLTTANDVIGILTYIESSGVSTSVIGGISSVTQLNVSETSTLGIVESEDIFSTGIITATGGFNIGISSGGTEITSGPVKTFNFIGAGNTFALNGTTVDISIQGGGESYWVSNDVGIHTLSNVGIGTTNPIERLQIGVANTDVVVVTDAGNLGIGTTNPTSKVHCNGDINLDDGGTYTTTLQTVTPTANRTISFPDATGTIGLVGGSSGQLIYNNAGAYAGASTLTYDGSILTTSGRFINRYNATASAPAKAFTGTWFTGGTTTTTKPHFLIEPTGTTSTAWSTSGTGLGVNAASGFVGNLLDLQVNGTSQFKADASTGRLWAGTGYVRGFGGTVQLGNSTGGEITIGGAGEIRLTSAAFISWNADTILGRDAADTLAQRRGTNAQTFRCYGTYTDASNYVRASLSSTSTAVTLAAETAGTGADDIPLNLTAAGTGTVKVNSVAEVAVSSTVAGLPATPAVGMLTRVTDASAPAVGSTVAGGGAAAALVWWNGSNWTVIGV